MALDRTAGVGSLLDQPSDGRPDIGGALDVLDRAAERTDSERPEIDPADVAPAPAPAEPPRRGPGRPRGPRPPELGPRERDKHRDRSHRKRKPKSKTEYKAALREAEAERAALAAERDDLKNRLELVSQPAAELSQQATGKSLAQAVSAIGAVLSRVVGPQWQFTAAECAELGEAWAVPLTPILVRTPVAARVMPWAGPALLTFGVVSKRMAPELGGIVIEEDAPPGPAAGEGDHEPVKR